LVFSVDQVEFSENGATFTLFGIKNDTSRSGCEVCIPRASVEKIDPIATLEEYIARTNSNRAIAGPVFISLRVPYAALTVSSVARILDESIALAGLADQGCSKIVPPHRGHVGGRVWH